MNTDIIHHSSVLQAAIACCVATTTLAQTGPLMLDSRADPYRGSGGSGVDPVQIDLAAGCGRIVRVVSATGTARACPSPCRLAGPDGLIDGVFCDPVPWETDIESAFGLSGIRHATRTLFIAGVFLTDDDPVPGSEPARLDFSDATDFESIEPGIAQLFFIGDGRQLGTGATQDFVAPAGATRLLLGFADGVCFQGVPTAYIDNEGTFEIELEIEVIYARADLDRDGSLTLFDFLTFQNWFDTGDLRADFDGDGELTIFDFLNFQNAFVMGCS